MQKDVNSVIFVLRVALVLITTLEPVQAQEGSAGCVEVTVETCRSRGFNMTAPFPQTGILMFESMEEATAAFAIQEDYAKEVCQEDHEPLLRYLCTLFFPPCLPSGHVPLPCPSLCHAAVDSCRAYVNNSYLQEDCNVLHGNLSKDNNFLNEEPLYTQDQTERPHATNAPSETPLCVEPVTNPTLQTTTHGNNFKNESCPESTDTRGSIWKKTATGTIAFKECVTYEVNSVGKISRNCSEEGTWKAALYNCTRENFVQTFTEIESLLENQTRSGVEISLSKLANVTEASEEMLEQEIVQSLTLLENIVHVDLSLDAGETTEATTQAYIDTASSLVDKKNEIAWRSIAEHEEMPQKNTGVRLLSLTDTYIERTYESLANDDKRTVSTKNIELEIVKQGDQDKRTSIVFPTQQSSHLYLSKEAYEGFTGYIAVLYKDLTEVLPEYKTPNGADDKDLNSAVLTLTLLPHNGALTTLLKEPVQLTFKHLKGDYSDPNCRYWNFDRNIWDSDGCVLTDTSHDVSVCECSHLTNFAILMSPWVKENVDTVAIGVISYIGCSLSSICLAITIGVHMFLWRYLNADRAVILINLAAALVISYIVFLAGVRQTHDKDGCTAVAMILHYIYLVVFMLMMAEGIEIAVIVLYVFPTKSRLKWQLPLAWGLPAVILAISAGATGLEGYGTESFCWLSTENSLIWAFAGPALVIMLANFVLLIFVIRKMFQTTAIKKFSTKAKTKTGIRCLCVLLPLMGCSWVLGVFYVSARAAWIQYIFALCNSFQGVIIFVFHCAFNEKVRTAIQNRRRRLSDSIPTSREKVIYSVDSETERMKKKEQPAVTPTTDDSAMSTGKKEQPQQSFVTYLFITLDNKLSNARKTRMEDSIPTADFSVVFILRRYTCMRQVIVLPHWNDPVAGLGKCLKRSGTCRKYDDETS